MDVDKTKQFMFYYTVTLSLLMCMSAVLQYDTSMLNLSLSRTRTVGVFIKYIHCLVLAGSYGTVSAAVHKETGEVVAVKRIPMQVVIMFLSVLQIRQL